MHLSNGSGRDTAILDPRVRRSRQMLHDALARLLETKDFDRISIGEIAEASTLNRATFYDHYPDKFALLACMVESRFSELLAARNVQVTDCAGALRAIALGVCDYLAQGPANGNGSQQGSVQTAVVGVVYRMLIDGLGKYAFAPNVSAELVASTVAWAIYGAANSWAGRKDRCPAETMADIIDVLIAPMVRSALADGGVSAGVGS